MDFIINCNFQRIQWILIDFNGFHWFSIDFTLNYVGGSARAWGAGFRVLISIYVEESVSIAAYAFAVSGRA